MCAARSRNRRTAASPSEAAAQGAPGLVEDGGDGLEHLRLVVHRSTEALATRRLRGRRLRLGMPVPAGGEENGEDGSLPRPALDLDSPPVTADDSLHRGQAQPPSRELGGEERIEDPRQGVLVHPAPSSSTRAHVGAGRQRFPGGLADVEAGRGSCAGR